MMVVPDDSAFLQHGFDGTEAKKDAAKPAETKPEPPAPPKRFVTTHKGTFHGVKVTYTATAGETHLKDGAGKPRAAIFSVAYVKDGAKDPTGRPVTFLFNGGPGSASLWLHLGVFGPKRLAVPSDGGSAGVAPFPLVDNPLCALDLTDLVFIDPVGTGYSRAIGEAKSEEFWGLDVDATTMADFRTHGRMTIPKASWHRASAVFHGFTLDDPGTLAEIRRLHTNGYLADPHTAIGIAAARAHMPKHGIPMIAMATAHPAKFPDAMQQATGQRPALPPALADLYDRPERYTRLPADLATIEAAVRATVLRNAA